MEITFWINSAYIFLYIKTEKGDIRPTISAQLSTKLITAPFENIMPH